MINSQHIGVWVGRNGETVKPDPLNPYRYALNNPTNLTDPSGLAAQDKQPFRLYDEQGNPVGTWTPLGRGLALATDRFTNIRCKVKDLDPTAPNPDADCVIGRLTVRRAVERRWRMVDDVKVGRDGSKEFDQNDPRNFHSVVMVTFRAEDIQGPEGFPKTVEFRIVSRPLKGKYFGVDNVGVFVQQHEYDVYATHNRFRDSVELRNRLELPDLKMLKTLAEIRHYMKTYVRYIETTVRPGPIKSGEKPAEAPAYPK